MMNYCIERIDAHTARLIGFISAEVFYNVAERVGEGEWYKRGQPRYNMKSHADNLVVEPEDLWLSFRED